MSQYILYGYWRSSCSQRVRLALHFKGIPFENRPVNLVKEGQHAEDYRQLNPMGQVPCLIDTRNERSLSQSLTIMDYLEQQHPSPSLYPPNAYDALRVRELCQIVNSGIQPLQNLTVLKEIGKRYQADAASKADWAATFIARGLLAFDTKLSALAGTYCFGDQVSAADMCLVPQIFGAKRYGVDMDNFPRLQRINEACLALEPFQKAEPAVQPDAVN